MTVAAEAPEPMTLEAWTDAMHDAAAHVRADRADVKAGSGSTRFTCRYRGFEFSLSFARRFEELSEAFKQHAIATVRALPQEWRPWVPK